MCDQVHVAHKWYGLIPTVVCSNMTHKVLSGFISFPVNLVLHSITFLQSDSVIKHTPLFKKSLSY